MQLIHASAHHLPMIPDESVHAICCSPPYFGLRKYQGGTGIEWPTVEYSPMPGLPPLRIQGCEPGCVHEWADGPTRTGTAQGWSDKSTLKSDGRAEDSRLNSILNSPKRESQPGATTQGAYCLHCGGWKGELGLEESPERYIAHLILCLREWKRILRNDGCAFVNLGDSYWGGKGKSGYELPHEADERRKGGKTLQHGHQVPGYLAMRPTDGKHPSIKPKDLIGIPFRLAFAAQADGWYLRSDIIWHKPNPLPESVTDRCTKSHEYIFMLAKSQTYYFDNDAIREPHVYGERGGAFSVKYRTEQLKAQNGSLNVERTMNPAGRNRRSVWTVSTQSFVGAHFATWPEKLVEPMILAGTSAYGCCPQCGAGYVRVVEKTFQPMTDRTPEKLPKDSGAKGLDASNGWGGTPRGSNAIVTTGWQPGCECNAGDPVPCTVLDPFHGSGTTGKVAARLGRDYIGVDVSQEYLNEITSQRFGDGIQMAISL